jgi:hypothetical protein
MNVQECARFVDAMGEAEKMMKTVQAALQLARSQSHGELYLNVDVMAKRAHELKVQSEWLRHVVLGKIDLPPPAEGAQNRQAEDRRNGIDRRIASMQSQLNQLGDERSVV